MRRRSRSARETEKGGADRVELCGNLVVFGTTPSRLSSPRRGS
ncbi:MAG: copper homeostasis protein CutC [Isosphaeraceae bacterium]